jgi:HipA-like protein
VKRKLDVYLHRHLVGNLVQDAHGQITFDYAETWLNNPAAIALSHSLPLTKKHFTKNECRGFFAGILPEESKREIIAKNLGISARNDYAMLEKIGGECAGAVTFMPAGTELPKREDILTARVEGDGITRAVFDGLLGRYIGIALHARQDLGNGTARYEGVGVQVPDQPVVSIWRLQLLDSIYSVPGGPAKGFLISTTPRGAGFGSGIPVPVPSNKKG